MSFRVLPGLPPYGPLPEQFSASGLGTHREGFVVEFEPGPGVSWVGNFQGGLSEYDAVLEVPGSSHLLVIASGQAYEIDPPTRRCIRAFGGQIECVFRHEDALIFSNGLWLEATGSEGLRWRSRRISWDGFRQLRLERDFAIGEAFNPVEDTWEPFSVDLADGRVWGGSYPPELPR